MLIIVAVDFNLHDDTTNSYELFILIIHSDNLHKPGGGKMKRWSILLMLFFNGLFVGPFHQFVSPKANRFTIYSS